MQGTVLYRASSCSCHRLELASIQTAKSVKEVKLMFGAMTNLWKLFYYSPKKVVTLANVQAVLNLPELKVVKPSDTRWLPMNDVYMLFARSYLH